MAKIELIRAVIGLPLPAYETRTLVALASLINGKTGCAYPSLATLAGLVNIDERNLFRALSGLQRRGLLAVSEQGTNRRTNRYAVDEAAVMAARGVSTDGAGPSLRTVQHRLYGRCRAVSTDGAAPSLQTVEGQLRSSEVQTKQQSKVSAPRSTRSLAPVARLRAAPKRPQNAWLKKYRPAADD
ncbi:MAG: helix-turn-helix domain-containing protein [Pseudomonadota bacterium]|nr:helix-turn-helix domain-containing protein [Pseudomonadota bacterium]